MKKSNLKSNLGLFGIVGLSLTFFISSLFFSYTLISDFSPITKCILFFKICTTSLISSRYLIDTILIIFIFGAGITALRQFVFFSFKKEVFEAPFPKKLRIAILQAKQVQPKISEVTFKFSRNPNIAASVIGLKAPVIVINPSLIEKLSPSELSAILLHEYAHIRRKDHLFSYFCSIFCSFLFLVPIAHFFHYTFIKGREAGADGLVKKWMGTPLPLAGAILKSARLTAKNHILHTGFISKSFPIKERILELIEERISFPLKKFLISTLLTIVLPVLILSPGIAAEKNRDCKPLVCKDSYACCHSLKQAPNPNVLQNF